MFVARVAAMASDASRRRHHRRVAAAARRWKTHRSARDAKSRGGLLFSEGRPAQYNNCAGRRPPARAARRAHGPREARGPGPAETVVQRPVVVFFRGVGDLSDAWAARLRGAWDVVLPGATISRKGGSPLLPVTEAVAVPPGSHCRRPPSQTHFRGRKVVVGGFSQGGALALAVASSHLKGVVAVSAWASSEKVAAPTLFLGRYGGPDRLVRGRVRRRACVSAVRP